MTAGGKNGWTLAWHFTRARNKFQRARLRVKMRFYGLGPGPPRLRVLTCRAPFARRSTVAVTSGGAGLSRSDTRRYIHRPRATSTPANAISPAIKAIRLALPVRKSWIVCQNMRRNRLGRGIDGPKATRAGGQSQTKWPAPALPPRFSGSPPPYCTQPVPWFPPAPRVPA